MAQKTAMEYKRNRGGRRSHVGGRTRKVPTAAAFHSPNCQPDQWDCCGGSGDDPASTSSSAPPTAACACAMDIGKIYCRQRRHFSDCPPKDFVRCRNKMPAAPTPSTATTITITKSTGCTPALLPPLSPPPAATTPAMPMPSPRRQLSVPFLRFPFLLLLTASLLVLHGSEAIIFHHNEEEQSGAVRCFCDKQTCGGGALVCADKFCLIGVRTDEATGHGRLEQRCTDANIFSSKANNNNGGGGVGAVVCAREWKQWSEVCICQENLCNTFAFLRSKIDAPGDSVVDGGGQRHQQQLFFPSSDNGGGGGDSSGGTGAGNNVQRSVYQQDPHSQNADQHGGGIIPWTADAGGAINDGTEGNGNGGGQRRAGEGEEFRRRSAGSPHQHHGGSNFRGSGGGGAPLVLLLVVLPLVVGAFTVFLVFLNYHCKML